MPVAEAAERMVITVGNRILTLEEVTTAGKGPIWYQGRYLRFADPVMYTFEHMPYLRFRVATSFNSNRHIKADPKMYGLTWRCWESKPTYEDMAKPFNLMEEAAT